MSFKEVKKSNKKKYKVFYIYPHIYYFQCSIFHTVDLSYLLVLLPFSWKDFFSFLINLFYFIYFWLHWVFIAVGVLSLVAASRGYSSLWSAGFSLWWLLLLWSMGYRHVGFSSCGSWALEHRLK